MVARVVTNLDELPRAQRACYFQSVVVGPPASTLEIVILHCETILSLFARDGEREYKIEGLPHIAKCGQLR